MSARRRERTVFDGLDPDDSLVPRVVEINATTIECYEEALAKVDDKIADLTRTRAAWVRLIKEARKRLRKL